AAPRTRDTRIERKTRRGAALRRLEGFEGKRVIHFIKLACCAVRVERVPPRRQALDPRRDALVRSALLVESLLLLVRRPSWSALRRHLSLNFAGTFLLASTARNGRLCLARPRALLCGRGSRSTTLARPVYSAAVIVFCSATSRPVTARGPVVRNHQ